MVTPLVVDGGAAAALAATDILACCCCQQSLVRPKVSRQVHLEHSSEVRVLVRGGRRHQIEQRIVSFN
jgi:hypothetical protein